MVDVIYPEAVSIEGYGLVGGLKGTGSMECPSQIRNYLIRYMMKEVPNNTLSTADKLLDSTDTAVVLIEAVMPVIDAKDRYFDVVVSALPGTQTTSLEGGWLFPAEMKIKGSFGITTDVLADVEGPVFTDKIDTRNIDKRTGYILGGGKCLTEYKVGLVLKKPDFELTNDIRNRLNGRFGRDVARAVLRGRIEVTVPAKYQEQKGKFISIIREMYLYDTPEANRARIDMLIRQLAISPESDEIENALEAIGNGSLAGLVSLLNESDERVRLRAARCMLSLGNNTGLQTLRQIALDRRSAYRLQALDALVTNAGSEAASSVARAMLGDEDMNIRIAAYEQLRKLDDFAVTSEIIDRSFFLEQIGRSERKTIFVTRSGQPRIVLFGAPIYCNRDIFVQSPDGQLTINAAAGQENVLLIRSHPKRTGVITQAKSSYDLGDIVRTFCMESVTEGRTGRGGLGVSYAEIIALLKKMSDKGAINAEFHAGPLPKIGLNVKK
ncbi:MAG: flagellar basal body P-ring protein FlgI [Sedimentisphaerales bacterium]|nr:flagellar basal body P-ring protein FlgI [Sedimentisphaerales bacterium]